MVDFDIEGPSGGPRNLGQQIDELLYKWDEVRRRPVALAVGALVVAILLGGAWLFTRSGESAAPAVDDRIPQVSLVPVTPPTTLPPVLLVHVTGAVHSPGVYQLESGDRVQDAIAAAGGSTADGQTDRLNLAAPVNDGMQIRVPVEGEAPVIVDPSASGGGTSAGPINLNTATAAQLETLTGVGPATAAAIIEYREESGGFAQVADLLGVRGIGEAKLASLDGLVVVQ